MAQYKELPFPFNKLKVGDRVTVHTDEVLKDNLPDFLYEDFWCKESGEDYHKLKGNTYKIVEFMLKSEESSKDYNDPEVDCILVTDAQGVHHTLSIHECYPTTPPIILKEIYYG